MLWKNVIIPPHLEGIIPFYPPEGVLMLPTPFLVMVLNVLHIRTGRESNQDVRTIFTEVKAKNLLVCVGLSAFPTRAVGTNSVLTLYSDFSQFSNSFLSYSFLVLVLTLSCSALYVPCPLPGHQHALLEYHLGTLRHPEDTQQVSWHLP